MSTDKIPKRIVNLIEYNDIEGENKAMLIEAIEEELSQALQQERSKNTRAVSFIYKLEHELKTYQERLEGWKEGGYLVSTEPDPQERDKVRIGLEGAIYAVQKIIDIASREGV